MTGNSMQERLLVPAARGEDAAAGRRRSGGNARPGHPRARDRAGAGAMDQGRESRSGEDLQQGRVRWSFRSSLPAMTGMAYLRAAGVAGKTDYLVIEPAQLPARLQQDSGADAAVECGGSIFAGTCSTNLRPTSSRQFVDERFCVLRHCAARHPAESSRAGSAASIWSRNRSAKRSAGSTSRGISRPQSKARMDQLVQNLLAAYRADIDTLDWMEPGHAREGAGEARKVHAQDRLPGEVARLQRAHDPQGRSCRQRDAGASCSSTSATSTSSASRSIAASGA